MPRRSRARRAVPAAMLAVASGLWMAAPAAAERLDVRFDDRAGRLEVAASELGEGAYEVRLITRGLEELELGADVNEPGIIYLPPREGPISLAAKPAIPAGAENVFFFNAAAAADEWELVLRFPDTVRGTWKLNGRFSPLGGVLQPETAIAAKALEPGENLFHTEGGWTGRPEMYFRRALPPGRRANVAVGLRPGAGGRVVLVQRDASGGRIRASEPLPASAPAWTTDPVPERWWEDPLRLERAVLRLGEHVLASQIQPPGSAFAGGFHLVYDTERRSHRIPHWIWAWGPTVRLLLDLERLPAAKRAGLDARFRAAALAAGRRSLGFEWTEPGHPAVGLSTVRWEPSRASRTGWVEYASAADSLFLAGWGWMACHAATGEPVFLERTQSLVAATRRLMTAYPVVPQDWVVERNRWTPHTLDESVFGMAGFRALHDATHAADVVDAGRRFLASHLEHMGRDGGLLDRAWLRDERRAIWDPDIKGHAWVVAGYLDAYQLTGDDRFLALARELGSRVADCQGEDGAWAVGFKRPAAGDPRDDKGTAIWAYYFYELHRRTGDPACLRAARRAVTWCLRHQARSADPGIDGAVVNTNSMAYVRRRPLTILYTNTFFALALLEERKLGAGPGDARGAR